jgi:hypothetical protein
VRGRDAIIEVFKFCHSWATLKPTLQALFGDGKRFCAEIRVAGTIIAAVEGIPDASVGRAFDFAEADVFDVEADQIKRMSIYADVVGFQKQIGA